MAIRDSLVVFLNLILNYKYKKKLSYGLINANRLM